MSAASVFSSEALTAGWCVEPHGYFRELGVTACHGSMRVSIDVDRVGRVLYWIRHTTDGSILGQSWSGETGKLASAIQELERGWDL